MTKIADLPPGSKLLCIKGFRHGSDQGEMWSNVTRLTEGKVYTKAETTSTGNIGIAACDAGYSYSCYWDDGEEHFVPVADEVFLIELWDESADTTQFQAICSDEAAVDRWVKAHWGNPVPWDSSDHFGYELLDAAGSYLGFDLLVTKQAVH